MDLNRMRLGLVYIFSENKTIPKKAKLELIKFIENADAQQLKTLSIYGEIVKKESLFDGVREIIDQKFSEDFQLQDKIRHASTMALIELTKLKKKM